MYWTLGWKGTILWVSVVWVEWFVSRSPAGKRLVMYPMAFGCADATYDVHFSAVGDVPPREVAGFPVSVLKFTAEGGAR